MKILFGRVTYLPSLPAIYLKSNSKFIRTHPKRQIQVFPYSTELITIYPTGRQDQFSNPPASTALKDSYLHWNLWCHINHQRLVGRWGGGGNHTGEFNSKHKPAKVNVAWFKPSWHILIIPWKWFYLKTMWLIDTQHSDGKVYVSIGFIRLFTVIYMLFQVRSLGPGSDMVTTSMKKLTRTVFSPFLLPIR